MDQSRLSFTERYLAESADVLVAAANDSVLKAAMVAIADAIQNSIGAGGKLLVAGNGGSAGDAQHIAGEFVSRLNFDRAPLPAIALTTDTSILTAVANDYGYDQVFVRQILALGRPGDVFIGISTSGRSPSIVKALQTARAHGLATVCFGGREARDMAAHCDFQLLAPSDKTPLIQQVHITAAHVICGLVEEGIFGAGR